MDDKIVLRVVSRMKCADCGGPYEEEKVKLMGHREDLWLLSVECAACARRSLAVVVVKGQEGSGGMTELTEADLERVAGVAPVKTDEVLDMHSFLQTFDGDFAAAFMDGGKEQADQS